MLGSDPKSKTCWVYVLECGDGSYYTGWTNDLDKRVRSRQSGKGGKYTRSRLPVKLIKKWRAKNRREAERSRERSRKAKRSRLTKREMAESKRRRAAIKIGRGKWKADSD